MIASEEQALAECRRSGRCTINRAVPAEHRRAGEFEVHLLNVSAHGFMAQGGLAFQAGERLSIRLPGVGWIEAHLAWNDLTRAGFQFERPLRQDEFTSVCKSLQA